MLTKTFALDIFCLSAKKICMTYEYCSTFNILFKYIADKGKEDVLNIVSQTEF